MVEKTQRTRNRKTLTLLPFLFFYIQNITAQVNATEAEKEKLAKILRTAATYCHKLENSAFDFVCLEDIRETTDLSKDAILETLAGASSRQSASWILSRARTGKKIVENYLLYDYQFIRKGKKSKERRTLLEENGKKKHKKNASLKTTNFFYKEILLEPKAILSEKNQLHHDYRILGEEECDGEKAVVLEALPKPTFKSEHLFGKVWVKESDGSILKIEWDQKGIENFEIIEKRAEIYNANPHVTLTSEFNLEKNGILFPSRFRIEESYINAKGEKFLRSETKVVYRDFRFFTVETEVKEKEDNSQTVPKLN
jgi:hypothetical protein